MTWDVDLVLMVRVLINDLGSTAKTDAEIQRTLVASCILVSQDIELDNTYVCDISAVTITPDPVVQGDGAAQALFPLKAACIINQGDFKVAIGQGIKVRDGDSQIDTTAGFRGYRDILELGACASYESLRRSIEASNVTSRGACGAVFSPFRKGGTSNSTIGFNTINWYNQFSTHIQNSSRRNRF